MWYLFQHSQRFVEHKTNGSFTEEHFPHLKEDLLPQILHFNLFSLLDVSFLEILTSSCDPRKKFKVPAIYFQKQLISLAKSLPLLVFPCKHYEFLKKLFYS